MRTVRATLLAALLGLGASASAVAEKSHESMSFNIPAQSLENALFALSKQSEYQIVFSSGSLPRREVASLEGTMSVGEALERLLAGTDLDYKLIGERTIAVGHTSTAENASAARTTTAGMLERVPGEAHLAQMEEARDAKGDPALAGAEEQGSEKLTEILVTAQKRAESIRDVPVPVTAISGESLVQNNQLRLQDYYASVPALNFTQDFRGGPILSIRGISSGALSNPTIGVVIDDVPYGASTSLGGGFAAPDFDPSDLARVEVLRGPQGTLYGANSIGGLIKYVTIDPTTDMTTGHVQAGLSSVRNGDDLGYSVRGAVNRPLSDAFAVRASAFIRRDAGYIDIRFWESQA